MKRLILVLATLCFVFPVYAKDLNVSVSLWEINSLTTSEKSGDELYFDIAEYGRGGLQQFYRIPESPMHLLSKHLDEFNKKNKTNPLSLWNGTLKEGESTSVLLSLIEEDSPPWDLDDLIGLIQLRLKNDGGKLISIWTIPNTDITAETISTDKGNAKRFKLDFSEHGNYQLDLLLSF